MDTVTDVPCTTYQNLMFNETLRHREGDVNLRQMVNFQDEGVFTSILQVFYHANRKSQKKK